MPDNDKPPMMGGVLLVGYHYWGWGEDLDRAKRQLRRSGGRLSDGYIIYEFFPEVEFQYVDNYGYIHIVDPKEEEREERNEKCYTQTFVKGAKTKR